MKKILALLVIIFCFCSCTRKGHNPLSRAHYYEERAVMFSIDYHHKHDHYPSYYIRERYYEHVDDDIYLDSLINKTPED